MAKNNVFFPLTEATLLPNPNGGSVQVVGVERGVIYRVCAANAIYIEVGKAAALNKGIYLPANTVEYFMFGMHDSQGVNLPVYVYAALNTIVHFTPVMVVV